MPPSTPAAGRPPARRLSAVSAVLASLALAAAPLPLAAAAPAPAWQRSAVVYGVVPSMFGAERPLQAVTARLPELADLGVDAIWLAPITATDDPGAISYAVTDHLRLRPDLGTEDDLRALVRAAHARRIRVLLDVVPSHTSTGHPFYRDAEARGRASPYWGYYLRDARGVAQHDFDWAHLKKLDFANPAVRALVTEAFARWIRDFDVDGFRVDAAWSVRDRSPDFWPELVTALRRLKPDLFLLAEASAREPYWVRAGFDAAYDWTGELGRAAWEHVFDDPARVGPALDAALAASAAPGSTPMHRVFRFLENNDTGARFVTRHGVARTRLAAVLLHTLPGVALVYTGGEVCAEYRPYEDPRPLDWRDRCGLTPLHRRLAALREELPALRDGDYRRVKVPGRDDVFAFVRGAGGPAPALVVANFGPAARLRLELPAGVAAPGWDALAGAPAAARAAGSAALELDLGREQAVVLVSR